MHFDAIAGGNLPPVAFRENVGFSAAQDEEAVSRAFGRAHAHRRAEETHGGHRARHGGADEHRDHSADTPARHERSAARPAGGLPTAIARRLGTLTPLRFGCGQAGEAAETPRRASLDRQSTRSMPGVRGPTYCAGLTAAQTVAPSGRARVPRATDRSREARCRSSRESGAGSR